MIWGKDMSEMSDIELEKRIDSLTDNQLKFVFVKILDYFEKDTPLLSEKEEEQLQLQEKKLLNNIADKLEIEETVEISERKAATMFLNTIYKVYPQYRKLISNIIMETESRGVTLDFGMTLALATVISAIAVAIVRPVITIKKVYDKKNDIYTEEITIASNSQDIASLIKSVFPFIK